MEFKITKSIGTVGEPSKTGWKKEINMVSWNGREPKYDIRDWAPDHDKMGKGITLTESEAREMANILNEYFAE